jgi:hypothetical protein
MGMTTVSVTIPEECIGDLYRYAAALVSGDPSVDGSDADVDEPAGNGRARWGMGTGAVKRAYRGGSSDYWPRFLEALAASPDDWLPWPDLCATIGLEPGQAAGMLGAAERRCKQRPPYEKLREGGVRYFRMPARVAEVIEDLASE